MTSTMIAALLRERDAYVRRGQDDRVRQVDEQLAHHGYEAEPTEEESPTDRTAPPHVTAEAHAGQKPADGKKPTGSKSAASAGQARGNAVTKADSGEAKPAEA